MLSTSRRRPASAEEFEDAGGREDISNNIHVGLSIGSSHRVSTDLQTEMSGLGHSKPGKL